MKKKILGWILVTPAILAVLSIFVMLIHRFFVADWGFLIFLLVMTVICCSLQIAAFIGIGMIRGEK